MYLFLLKPAYYIVYFVLDYHYIYLSLFQEKYIYLIAFLKFRMIALLKYVASFK